MLDRIALGDSQPTNVPTSKTRVGTLVGTLEFATGTEKTLNLRANVPTVPTFSRVYIGGKAGSSFCGKADFRGKSGNVIFLREGLYRLILDKFTFPLTFPLRSHYVPTTSPSTSLCPFRRTILGYQRVVGTLKTADWNCKGRPSMIEIIPLADLRHPALPQYANGRFESPFGRVFPIAREFRWEAQKGEAPASCPPHPLPASCSLGASPPSP
jgi:hypothetical protein